MPALNKLYNEYRGHAEFWIVYIAEAHASDVWQLAVNERDEVIYASPSSIEERAELAAVCVRELGIEFPAIVDDFDNSVEEAYTAWPDRLYVVDVAGRIAYKSEAGPYGFSPTGVEATLERLLGGSHELSAALEQLADGAMH